MKDSTLGSLIDSTAKRDAIHIAIAPVVASAVLIPGQHVGFTASNQETVGPSAVPIGIVDPFLTNSVLKGERFFLCLYPKSITSLRHEWTHPAFLTESAVQSPDRTVAEQRIRKFAESIGVNYEWVMDKLSNAIAGDAYGGDDSMAEAFNAQKGDLFAAYAVLTGKFKNDIEGTYFRCAC